MIKKGETGAPVGQVSQALTLLNDICGCEWLSRSSARWEKNDWAHPMVRTFRYASEALKKEDSAILRDEHALRVMFWARNISAVKDLVDLPKFQQRSRVAKGCDKLLYEIQVAAFYRGGGYGVTFHDVNQPGCDIAVSNRAGTVNLECKKKGETERDRRMARECEALSQKIEKSMVGMARFAYIFVETGHDLTAGDHERIELLVRNLLEKDSDQHIVEGDYRITVEHIRPGGSTERGNFFGITYPTPNPGSAALIGHATGQSNRVAIGPRWPEVPQSAMFQCESKRLGDNLFEAGKVMAIGFRSLEQRDYIKTVMASFDEVRKRKQLPTSAPGVIYIEIGQPSVGVTVEQRFDEIARAIQPKLQGECNRRVNAVVLTCTGKGLENVVHGGETMTLPRIVVLGSVVKHASPRLPLPPGFRLGVGEVFGWVV